MIVSLYIVGQRSSEVPSTVLYIDNVSFIRLSHGFNRQWIGKFLRNVESKHFFLTGSNPRSNIPSPNSHLRACYIALTLNFWTIERTFFRSIKHVFGLSRVIGSGLLRRYYSRLIWFIWLRRTILISVLISWAYLRWRHILIDLRWRYKLIDLRWRRWRHILIDLRWRKWRHILIGLRWGILIDLRWSILSCILISLSSVLVDFGCILIVLRDSGVVFGGNVDLERVLISSWARLNRRLIGLIGWYDRSHCRCGFWCFNNFFVDEFRCIVLCSVYFRCIVTLITSLFGIYSCSFWCLLINFFLRKVWCHFLWFFNRCDSLMNIRTGYRVDKVTWTFKSSSLVGQTSTDYLILSIVIKLTCNVAFFSSSNWWTRSSSTCLTWWSSITNCNYWGKSISFALL